MDLAMGNPWFTRNYMDLHHDLPWFPRIYQDFRNDFPIAYNHITCINSPFSWAQKKETSPYVVDEIEIEDAPF